MSVATAIKNTSSLMPVMQTELFVMGRSNYVDFLHFNTKCPQVYLLFEKFAFQLIAAGHTKLGAKMILERIRWEISIGGVKDDDGFKINNNYTAYYSRQFVKNNPAYEDYFEFRVIRKM
jgi:hypothetical protein